MNGSLPVLAYAACGFLIVVYAWGRSTTPPSRLGVGVALLLYVAAGGPFLAHIASLRHQQVDGLMAASKIAHVQLVTIGLTVWLIVRRAILRRASGDPPRFSGYVVNSVIAFAIGVGICLAFHSGDTDPLAGAGRDLQVILISFPLCAAVACFRDHRAEDLIAPAWLRRAEASAVLR
jgi:hypothetical protein